MSVRMGTGTLAETWARRDVLRFPAFFGANAPNFSLAGIMGAAIPAALAHAFSPGTFLPFGFQPAAPVVRPAAGPGAAPALPLPAPAIVPPAPAVGGAAVLGGLPPAPPAVPGLLVVWFPASNMWAHVPAPAAPAPVPATAVAAPVGALAPALALAAAAVPAAPVGAPVRGGAIQHQPNKAGTNVVNVAIALTPQEAARANALAAEDDDGRDTPSVFVKTLKNKMGNVRTLSTLVQAISRLENLPPKMDAAHPNSPPWLGTWKEPPSRGLELPAPAKTQCSAHNTQPTHSHVLPLHAPMEPPHDPKEPHVPEPEHICFFSVFLGNSHTPGTSALLHADYPTLASLNVARSIVGPYYARNMQFLATISRGFLQQHADRARIT